MLTANPTLCGVIQLWVCSHLIVFCWHFKSACSIFPTYSKSWIHWETMIVVADLFKCRLNAQLPKVKRTDSFLWWQQNWTSAARNTHRSTHSCLDTICIFGINTHSWALLSHHICSGADKDPSYNERELLHADRLLFHLHSDLPDLESPIIHGFLRGIQGFEKISLTSVERLVDVQPALHAF